MSELNLDWIEQYLGARPTVLFDVGSYNGEDGMFFKARFPQATVHSFEACPNAYAEMAKAKAVKASGIIIHHLAASDRDGEIEFNSNVDGRSGGLGCSGSILKPTPHNLVKYDFLQFKEARRVPSTRLDTFCAANKIDHIDVLHMDVQGAEGYVIEGLGKLRPKLLFFEVDATDEYYGSVPLADLFAKLTGWGYEKKWQGAHDVLFVFRQTNALDGLTVCVTNFHRPALLDRTLKSCRDAGIRRITISSSDADDAVRAVIDRHRDGWLSFDVAFHEDVGCNASWLIAVYRARTSRVLVLHDDDILLHNFGQAYCNTISPAMDAGAGFASWRPNILHESGATDACEYRTGPTGVFPSSELAPVIASCLTHSPVISVFNRETVIHACKEAEQTLVKNDSLQRQGMLLGTELVVYLRHIEAFPQWLYVDQILSSFGSHPNSGTVAEVNKGADAVEALRKGYALARTQGRGPKPEYRPRLLLLFSDYPTTDAGDERRQQEAEVSWQFHFGNADVIELPVAEGELPRSAASLGDKPLPYIRDLLDIGCSFAMPEDVVVYINRDVGLTTQAPELLLAGLKRGNGVTVCPRRMLFPKQYRLYKTVTNCKHDGGFDVMALTPQWWKANRDKMPDMLIGREAWDGVFRTLAEEWADGCTKKHLTSSLQDWLASKAYTDNVCWHEPHQAAWNAGRATLPGQIHNRKLARAFFAERGNTGLVQLIDSLGAVPQADIKPPHFNPTRRHPVAVPTRVQQVQARQRSLAGAKYDRRGRRIG